MTDDLAKRFQKLRQAYGLSQRELAKRAGVTNSSISMIEQGRVSPSVSSLEKLLRAIPISLKDFFRLNLDQAQPCFYPLDELRQSEHEGFHRSDLWPTDTSTMSYQRFQPGASTGEVLVVSHKHTAGFVVEGNVEITIKGEQRSLSQGEGFVIGKSFPYRIHNITEESAAVVLQQVL